MNSQHQRLTLKLTNLLQAYRDQRLFSSAYLEFGSLNEPAPREVVALYSDTARVFDLASLTKPLVTAALYYQAALQKKISLNDAINDILPRPFASHWEPIYQLKLEALLSHQSGLSAWCNFFTGCEQQGENQTLAFLDRVGRLKRFDQILKRGSIKISSQVQDCYSDVGYILLGIASEHWQEKTLNHQFIELCHRLGLGEKTMQEIGFLSELTRETITTGYSRVYKAERIRQCFDENAVALGQVCGHAGLFATGEALGCYLRSLFGQSKCGQKMLAKACSDMEQKRPVLGLRVGDDPATSPFAAGKSLGHYGFSGTSFWINPQSNSYYLLLTNRTRYARIDPRIRELRQEVASLVEKAAIK